MEDRLSRIAPLNINNYRGMLKIYPNDQLDALIEYVDDNRGEDWDMGISDEQYNALWEEKDQREAALDNFRSSGDPSLLLHLSKEEAAELLGKVPEMMKNGEVKQAKDVIAVLGRVPPSDFPCEDFDPLLQHGDSCYADSVLFALLAVPNEFIT